QEVFLHVGVLADDLVRHPGAIDPERGVVLGLARHLAGHAADAATRVDHHREPALARHLPGLDRRDPEFFTHAFTSVECRGPLRRRHRCAITGPAGGKRGASPWRAGKRRRRPAPRPHAPRYGPVTSAWIAALQAVTAA